MGKRLVYCLGSLMERLAPYEYPSSNLPIEGFNAVIAWKVPPTNGRVGSRHPQGRCEC